MTFFNNLIRTLSMNQTKQRQTIALLTLIRNANYNVSAMKDVSEGTLAQIKELSLVIGSRLIKSDLEEINDLESFRTVKKSFNETATNFVDNNSKFSTIIYACQLLQYYTVRCNKACNESDNINDFQRALLSPTIGDTTTNLFVKEHELIMLYNDIVKLEQSSQDKDEQLEQLNLLVRKLVEIKLVIDKTKIDIPNNTFPHYLNFIINYTCAKALEIQFEITKSELSDEQQTFASSSQQAYLKLAQSDLHAIDLLNNYSIKQGRVNVNGFEYGLGQDLFRKMPEGVNSNIINAHLDSLIEPGPSTPFAL